MDKKVFNKMLSEKILILDGATGTQLQKKGMPVGVCPEQWVLEHPESIIAIQKDYMSAGSDIIYSCTFGANRFKLNEFGLGDKVAEFNRKLVELSKQAVGPKCLVAGDLAPTGTLMEPFGSITFEECVNIYKEQVRALLEGGVDLFVIETMIDIQEARAALLAVKESCELPVIVSMSYDKKGRTLSGTDPVTALITLQSLGADAVGCNCSTGPEQMVDIISMMKPYAKVPLFAKPNAGLPRLVDSSTVFDMDAATFGSYAEALVKAGANMLGGCCGTSPEYILKLKENTENLQPAAVRPKPYSALTSTRKTVFFGADYPVGIIGERINPTGKKKLQEELKNGLTDLVGDLAAEQVEKGAQILDVNAGMPGIDEKDTLKKLTDFLSWSVNVPLSIDTTSPEALEAALRVYPGRALVNSVSLEESKIKRMLPIAAKYGAMFILLPLDDNGVPEKAEQRQEIVQRVYEEATKYGYTKSDIIVDGLVMTVSSNQEAASETLKVVKWCSEEFGSSTVLGISNVSFGLPERSWVNAAFLAMAIGNGLTMAIANPSTEILMNIKLASDVLAARDKNCMNYITAFSKQEADPSGTKGITQNSNNGKNVDGNKSNNENSSRSSNGSGGSGSRDNSSESDDSKNNNDSMVSNDSKNENNGNADKKGYNNGNSDASQVGIRIFDDVVKGNKDEIKTLIDEALKEGIKPETIVDEFLIPAINKVGVLFDERKYFLPQLICSAEAMKTGFDYIEPLLKGNSGVNKEDSSVKKDGRCVNKVDNETVIVLATVKGDIHDIGKNIVALMLRNYGFKVHDLGKDVNTEKIITEAKRLNAEIIGLSALMTTTMIDMGEVVKQAKKEGLTCKIIVGGAVVNEEYAKQIGADGYAKDAYDAVKLVQRLTDRQN